MKTIDVTLQKNEVDFLKNLKGKKIRSFKGYELFSDLATWHETLVFQTGKQNFSIENQFLPVPFSNDEGEEDFAVLKVSNGPAEIWLPTGMKPKTKKIDKTIEDVLIVNCRVEYRNVKVDTNTFKFTQAIIFRFENDNLVINRDIWFNDFLIVRAADDYRKAIRDVGEDWMCEEGEYVDVEQHFISVIDGCLN